MGFIQTIQRPWRAVTILRVGLICSGLVCVSLLSGGNPQQGNNPAAFPSAETLSYRIEWRMVTAGSAKLKLERSQQNWQINMNLESAGLVSRLYRIQDNYKVLSDDKFCALNSAFEAQEGKRHVKETQQFDYARKKSAFEIHDLARNVQERHEIDIVPCTHEIVGALQALRLTKLDAGKSVTMPIANGKKMAYARIEAQAKEDISVDGKSYSTTRYEAFIFDNVVFRKKGSLLVWISNDAAHVPVQMRFQMGFPIGSITLELEKAERS